MKFILPIALLVLTLTAGAQNITPKKYNVKIGTGAALFTAGVTTLGLAIVADNYKPITDNYPKIKKPGIALGFSFGAASTVAGAVLLGLGLNEKNIYQSKSASLNIICSDRFGLACRF